MAEVKVQQRSLQTKSKVIDAAVATLAERGFAATTVNEICERAGVSQGGMFRHFATKEILYSAVVDHVFRFFTNQFVEEVPKLAALAQEGDSFPVRARRLLDVMWRIFHTRELLAAGELYVAARTHADLAEHLAESQEPHRGRLLIMCQTFFPEYADHPDLGDAAFVAVDAMRGFILGNFGSAHPNLEYLDRSSDAFLDLVTTILTNHLSSTIVPAPRSIPGESGQRG